MSASTTYKQLQALTAQLNRNIGAEDGQTGSVIIETQSGRWSLAIITSPGAGTRTILNARTKNELASMIHALREGMQLERDAQLAKDRRQEIPQ